MSGLVSAIDRLRSPHRAAPERASQASLVGVRCPYCDKALLQLQQREDYRAYLTAAETIVVPVALVNICPECDGHVVTEREWERMNQTARSSRVPLAETAPGGRSSGDGRHQAAGSPGH